MYNNWFNEIPIYKSDVLPEFFFWLDSLNCEKYKDNWYCFEYHIFTAFLLIEKGFKLKRYEYESLGGIMEYLYVFEDKKRKEIQEKFKSHWASADNCIDTNTFVMFHIDRDLNSEAYHIKDFSEHIRQSRRKRIKLLIKDLLLGDKVI
jgi:hypothetical protein